MAKSRKTTGNADRTPAKKQAISAKAVPAEVVAQALPSNAPAGRPSSLIETRGIYCGDCLDHRFPMQVKLSENVGRPDVDAFADAMHRDNRSRGFMVAFSFSSDVEGDCARIYKQVKRIIKLLTVQEILDEEFVQKM